MTAVAPPNSTVSAMRQKVRKLTAVSSELALPTAVIDEYINTFYTQDFPYAIKLDQTRQVYTFFTQKYIDRYPLDVNGNQGIRAPVYFEGVKGFFYKDREQFYNMWPRWPTKFQQAPTVSTGTITLATQFNPCQITSAAHGLSTGNVITITGVVGMTELNGNNYIVTVTGANTFTINADSSLFTPYISGGTWTTTNTSYNFTISAGFPFLSTMVVIGGTDINGDPIKIVDDGGRNTIQGNLLYIETNNVGNQTPPTPNTSPIPPATPIPSNSIGTVNYVTGEFGFTLPIAAAPGSLLTIWVSQYSLGRPYSLLFWNNEFQVRPVPDDCYKVEVETYLSPIQFLESTDSPLLNQWWQYLSYGAAIEILRDRQDMEGVENLMEGFKRQEALVLERQATEEIGQRNTTIFSQTVQQPSYGTPQGWY